MSQNLTSLITRIAIAILSILPICAHAQSASGNPKKPNIVFIISDDHRWDCIGVAGNPNIHTPNIDSLAKDGVYFKQGTVVTPQCSPIRASMLTGLPPHANGWFSNQTQLKERRDPNGFKGIPTMPGELAKAGYRTVLVGKWHQASDPWNVGFNEVRTWLPAGGGPYKDIKLAHGNSRETSPTKGFLQDILGEDAANFISSPKAKEKPFFLWLALTAPHTPLKPNPESCYKPYEGKSNEELAPPGFTQGTAEEALTSFTVFGGRRAKKSAATTSSASRQATKVTQWKDYNAAVTSADQQVGRVREALKQAALDKNTIVVFLGDNGMMRGSRGWDGKVLPYEESVRVPFVVHAPGLAKVSGKSEASVSSLDLPASFLKWAGVEVPESWPGRDMTPVLQSTDTTHFEHAYAEHADNVSAKFGAVEYRMVRSPKAKLIQWRDTTKGVNGEEFFDLEKDPRELNNQVTNPEMKDTVADLRMRLERWKKKTADGPPPTADQLTTGEGED